MFDKITNFCRKHGVSMCLSLASLSVVYSIYPYWHNETPMPKNLRDKIN